MLNKTANKDIKRTIGRPLGFIAFIARQLGHNSCVCLLCLFVARY
jgi:hypothetical protein